MDIVCFALPIAGGKTDAVRSFMHELETERRGDFVLSEQRIGVVRESWFLQQTPAGDLLVAYMESPDFARALRTFSGSDDAFDRWFKDGIKDVTGVDLDHAPPGPLSQMLSHYEADEDRIIPEWG